MIHLIICLFFFLLTIIIHIMYCRGRDHKVLHIKPFVIVSALNACLLLASFVYIHFYCVKVVHPLFNHPLPGTAFLIYLMLIPAYMTFYGSTVLMSPSKKIITVVEQNGIARLGEFKEYFNDQEFIVDRLDDMVKAGFMHKERNRYGLTPAGQRLNRFLLIYEKILGREVGG